MELFPEDSPIGTCKWQAPDIDWFQKRPYSCFAVENGIFAKEGGLQMGISMLHPRPLGAYLIHTNYTRLNRIFLSAM